MNGQQKHPEMDAAQFAEMARRAGEVIPAFNLETLEAFGAWVLIESVIKETKILTSKPIRTGVNLVHLVGPAFEAKTDLQPGDSIIFGGGGIAMEFVGPNGGPLIQVLPQHIVAIDRSWRKKPKREKARAVGLSFFRTILELLEPKPDGEPKPPAGP
jgi:hypothetical protein